MAAIMLTRENFEKEVLQSEIPVVVDFFATWCGPCKMLGPVISEIAEEYAGKVKVCKLDIDEEMDIADKYMVMSVPTVKLFKNGEVTSTSIGFRQKAALVKMLGI